MSTNKKPWEHPESQIPTRKQVWMEMHQDEVWEIADQADWHVSKVDCDDNGDAFWKYKVEYEWLGEIIATDYFHREPDTNMCYNSLLNALKDGQLGIDMSERLWEKEKVLSDKYKTEEGVGAPRRDE